MDYLLVNQAMFNKYNHIDSNGAYVINKSITRPNWLIDVFNDFKKYGGKLMPINMNNNLTIPTINSRFLTQKSQYIADTNKIDGVWFVDNYFKILKKQASFALNKYALYELGGVMEEFIKNDGLVVIDNHIIHKNYKPRTAKDWSSKLEKIII